MYYKQFSSTGKQKLKNQKPVSLHPSIPEAHHSIVPFIIDTVFIIVVLTNILGTGCTILFHQRTAHRLQTSITTRFKGRETPPSSCASSPHTQHTHSLTGLPFFRCSETVLLKKTRRAGSKLLNENR